MAITLSLEIEASCVVGRRDLLMKYNQRWALMIRQVSANVLIPFGDVFHFDLGFAIVLRASSISSRVGDSIILFPSTFE